VVEERHHRIYRFRSSEHRRHGGVCRLFPKDLNAREKYVEAFWDIVNWDFASANFK
jgi:iron/manganese superoxide dismutase-like protein